MNNPQDNQHRRMKSMEQCPECKGDGCDKCHRGIKYTYLDDAAKETP